MFCFKRWTNMDYATEHKVAAAKLRLAAIKAREEGDEQHGKNLDERAAQHEKDVVSYTRLDREERCGIEQPSYDW